MSASVPDLGRKCQYCLGDSPIVALAQFGEDCIEANTFYRFSAPGNYRVGLSIFGSIKEYGPTARVRLVEEDRKLDRDGKRWCVVMTLGRKDEYVEFYMSTSGPIRTSIDPFAISFSQIGIEKYAAIKHGFCERVWAVSSPE